MRILQISSAKTFGGGERHFVDLCRGLQGRGHSVFAALRPTNEWQNRLGFLPAENILHVSIRNSFGILSANKIGGFIRDNEIDIVHAHVARDYIPASIACMLAKKSKFVLTRHVLFPLKPFNRFALKNLSKAIAVSSGVETSLQKVFARPKIEVIPNGIDIENWSNADHEKLREEFRLLHGIPSDVPLIGTVGELIPLKGQRDFVLATNEIVKTCPNAHFVVVGKDNTIDKRFRRELKRLVKVFRLDDRFLWLDWVEDTAELFAALDIFVSASHSESFGLAILEAMASGTAVVATETEGAKELLAEKGMLVPLKDPVKLAEVICSFVEDSEKRRMIVDQAKRLASEKFSLRRMIDQTEALYKSIC
ncbi:MAG: glycosyltransferase family 4 protein [Pyrinomonadaceae bacterium]